MRALLLMLKKTRAVDSNHSVLKHTFKLFYRSYWSLLFILFFVSCGYRSTLSSNTRNYKIYVDKVPGDIDGLFRRELMNQVCKSPGFELSYEKTGALILTFDGWKFSSEDLGYQFDRTPITAELINRLVPSEGMWRLGGTIHLEKNGRSVIDPIDFECLQNFDFVDSDSLDDLAFINSDGQLVSGLQFSLGQLDARQGAMEGSQKPLIKRFAQKVLTLLSSALILSENGD